MKIKSSQRRSKKMLFATLIVPIAMCLVILIALTISFIQTLMGGAIQSAVDAARINAYNSQELVFSLLGVAITVWIGLNIYNVLSKEELNVLLDKADEASKITENAYTQVLISKLRLLPADRIENYLASRLQKMERLPGVILEKMILVEDIFNYAYALYKAGTAGQPMRDGLKLVEELAQEIEACEKDGAFSRKQHDFLLGYMALRQADLAFFWAQYDKTEGENVKKSHGKEILKHYYAALNELFGIKDLSMCDVQGYLPEDYQGLPMMANNICSVYTTLIGKDVIEENDYPTAIAAGECAVKLGTEVAPNVKAIFYRNLGIIYEWSQQMDKAIDAYFEAYKLDHKSPKILHCIASWHRKWFCMKYPFLDPRQTPNHIRVKAADYADAVNLLERTAYWYWLEQISNGGSVLKWPYDLSEYVSRLENRGASVDKKLMTLLDEVNQCHEDLASTKEKYMIWKQQTSPGLLALPGDKKTGKR